MQFVMSEKNIEINLKPNETTEIMKQRLLWRFERWRESYLEKRDKRIRCRSDIEYIKISQHEIYYSDGYSYFKGKKSNWQDPEQKCRIKKMGNHIYKIKYFNGYIDGKHFSRYHKPNTTIVLFPKGIEQIAYK